MWLIGFVGSKLGRLVASVLAVMASILLAFQLGKKDMKKNQEVKNLKDYKKAKEAEDEVDTNLDRASRIDRMRDNGSVRPD